MKIIRYFLNIALAATLMATVPVWAGSVTPPKNSTNAVLTTPTILSPTINGGTVAGTDINSANIHFGTSGELAYSTQEFVGNSLTTLFVSTDSAFLTGTVAGSSLAVTFSPASFLTNGSRVTVMSTIDRASVTWNHSGSGNTFAASAPTSLSANVPVTFNLVNTVWYPALPAKNSTNAVLTTPTITTPTVTGGTFNSSPSLTTPILTQPVISGGSITRASFQTALFSTAGLTAITVTTDYAYLNGTAGASLAITFGTGLFVDGNKVTIMSTAARSLVTWISSGHTFVGAPTSLTANVSVTFHLVGTVWYLSN